MNEKVRLACESEVVIIPLSNLLPTRSLKPTLRKTSKYLCIQSSIRELGIIEPLVVFPQPDNKGFYTILDGNTRFW